jgi:site-specific recombinase XerC
VTGHVIDVNPAHAVRGPKHLVRKGKTPVLLADETRQLLDSIESTTAIGLRDRALVALMTFTFARVGAAVKMRATTISFKTAKLGPASRRAARSMRCRATIVLMSTCTNTSPGLASARARKAFWSGRPRAIGDAR